MVRVGAPPGVGADDLDARLALLRVGRVVGGYPSEWRGHGEFRFDRKPAGEYELLVVANGFRAPRIPVEIAAARPTTLHVDRWERATPLRGRVVGWDGEPAKGVELRVYAGESVATGTRVLGVESGEDGAFAFDALFPIERQVLAAKLVRGRSAVFAVDWKTPEQDLEVQLVRPAR